MNRKFRLFRRFFSGSPVPCSLTFWKKWRSYPLALQTIIQCFYFVALLLCMFEIPNWQFFFSTAGFSPLWPVVWLNHVPLQEGITAILGFYLVAALAAATWPESRWIRIALFIALLEITAYRNSFGKIGHSNHLMLLISAVLIFLPRGWDLREGMSRMQRMKLFYIFWTCQALLLLTYTLSGLGKIVVGTYQMLQGKISVFHPQALAIHIAERLLQTNSISLVGDWFVSHYWIGWPMMLGAIYLQFFSLWVVFRPTLQNSWTLALIGLHLGIYFTMTILFPVNGFLLALFFLASPFNPKEWSSKNILKSLPIVGFIFNQVKKVFLKTPSPQSLSA